MSKYIVCYEEGPSCYDPYVSRSDRMEIVSAQSAEGARSRVKGPGIHITDVYLADEEPRKRW